MIRKKAMVFTFGQMDVNMKACGVMVNNMAKANSLTLKVKARKAFGKMVRELNGLIIKKITLALIELARVLKTINHQPETVEKFQISKYQIYDIIFVKFYF